MQPPLATGTLLQDRYNILRQLGQGGFARTYLAQDHGRFNELCVLKEWIPNQNNDLLLDKARELFEREAAALYQIQHAQVPRFRATFEYLTPPIARLFLVQDYVAGNTYRQLLTERKQQGSAFAEVEVRDLLQQLLPVLQYLHQLGIIHRDISPENLILRLQDQCPVLIDFGVVKEIATQVQSQSSTEPGTVVGKLGFAPVEQLQSGRVYPSSDLYSLAVTAVVLLTGQEPQDLFEDQTATWRWQRQVNITDGFAAVLDRMLAHKPGDRFQAAQEILATLETLPPPSLTPISTPFATSLSGPGTTVETRDWQVAFPQVADSSVQPRSEEKPQSRQRSGQRLALGRRLGLVPLGLGIAVLAGTIGFFWRSSQQPLPLPLPSVATSPIPQPSLTPVRVTDTRPLVLIPGAQAIIAGTLQDNEVLNYQFSALTGQSLGVIPDPTLQVEVKLLDPNNRPLPGFQSHTSWRGTLPTGGIYALQLRAKPGVNRGRYQLTVSLNNPTSPGITITSPGPSASPTTVINLDTSGRQSNPNSVTLSEGTRIGFSTGERIKEVTAYIRSRQVQRYWIRGRSGRTLSAVVVNGFVTLNIRNSNGKLLPEGKEVLSWESRLPTTGDYQIEVVGLAGTNYRVKLGLR
jgi:serine/threonine protein kinase